MTACPGFAAQVLAGVTAALFALTVAAFAARAPDAPFAGHRNDRWKVIGPGGGGAQFNPSISPLDPTKVLVSCDMTCAFVSGDGGDSWRMANLRGVVEFFAFDPTDRNVIYAKSIGLWRSTDAGATWNLVHPAPSNVERLIHAGDHAADRIITKDGSAESIEALAVDPGNPRTLYAVFAAAGGAVLRVSTDWGKTWSDTRRLPNGGRAIYIDPKSPAGDRTIYVVTGNSAGVRERGKWTDHKGPDGVTRFNGMTAGFPPQGGKLVLYGVAGRAWRGSPADAPGIYASRDGGETWLKTDGDLVAKGVRGAPLPQMNAIAACLTRPDVVYVSYQGLVAGEGRSGSLLGVAKSADGGRTWSLVWKDTFEKAAPNFKGIWIDERYDPTWGESPLRLCVAPSNPDICVGTDMGRTVRTTDGGKTWQAVNSRRVPAGGWSTTGLDVSCCYAVHWDPFDLDHMFISYTDIGLMVSKDGGVSWDSATTKGVPPEWFNATYWVEFDPEVKGLVWAAMSGTHDLPRPKMWRRGTDHWNGGIVVSTDGGGTWSVSGDWRDNKAPITEILLDPASPAGERTLHACAFGRGVLKSVDNGTTWTLKNKGIDRDDPFAWRLARADDGTLYLVVFRRSEDGRIGDADDGAVYRSTDGAESWEKLPLPEGSNGPSDIAIHPRDPNRILLSAWGRADWESGDTGGGVFLSTDAGRTWKCVLNKDQHIHDLTVDPRNGVCYACGHESNAWRSADGGETWRRIKGYNFKWGRKVVPDPRNADMVYITTFGGSVWYGPAEGDPAASEDIVTPEVAYGR